MRTGASATGREGPWARRENGFERSLARTMEQVNRDEIIETASIPPDAVLARSLKRDRGDDAGSQHDARLGLLDYPQDHRRSRTRCRIQRGEDLELSQAETPAYATTDEASTMASLLHTRGQVPRSANEESAIQLLRAGVSDQNLLSHHLAPPELMHSMFPPAPMLLVDRPFVPGTMLAQALLPGTLPLTMDVIDPAIIQRQQLLALSAGSPLLLDYSAAGLVLPPAPPVAPMLHAPAHQIHGTTAGVFEPSALATSLAEGGSRALANLGSALTESRPGRNERFIENAPRSQVLPPLPPCVDGPLKHHSERLVVPLSTDEDENWLSEFLCFVRSDLIEVFRAGREDVVSRINSKKISYGQIGIRCRFCAHLPHSARTSRSSSFPSSVSRIYQSLTMMLRDHFPRCTVIPEDKKSMFLSLKAKTTQGATDSKRYWLDSAEKLGMIDTPHGIVVTESTQLAALSLPPYGSRNDVATVASSPSRSQNSRGIEAGPPVLLVSPGDRELVSEYLFLLVSQVQRVYLTESERVGNRKNLEVGLPGLGCRHCCPTSRKGLCRLFPARRRTLPAKVKDLHDHLRRCTLCPEGIKGKLSSLKLESEESISDNERLKYFFDRVWARLYRGTRISGESGKFNDLAA